MTYLVGDSVSGSSDFCGICGGFADWHPPASRRIPPVWRNSSYASDAAEDIFRMFFLHFIADRGRTREH
jgi:hypothetical protein